MKICVLHSRYNSKINSGENLIAELQKLYLNSSENSFSFIFIDNHPSSLNIVVKYLKIFANSLFSVEAIISVLKARHREKFDLFLIHNLFPNFGLLFYLYLRLSKIPYIMVLHNFRYRCISGAHELNGQACFQCSSKKYGVIGILNRCFKKSFLLSIYMAFFRLLTRMYIKNSTSVICLSEYAKSELLTTRSIPKNLTLNVIPNFIPSISSNKSPTGYEFMTIFYAGRLEASKGIEFLLNNWKISNMPSSGWKLVICGEGSLSSLVANLASQDQSIIYLGLISHDEVIEQLKKTTFSVIPSIGTENCPTSIIESFAQSVPVIGPNSGSVKEMITPINGLKFDTTEMNLYLIFNQIVKLSRTEYLNFKPYQSWEVNYSPNSVIPKLFEVFENSIQKTFDN